MRFWMSTSQLGTNRLAQCTQQRNTNGCTKHHSARTSFKQTCNLEKRSSFIKGLRVRDSRIKNQELTWNQNSYHVSRTLGALLSLAMNYCASKIKCIKLSYTSIFKINSSTSVCPLPWQHNPLESPNNKLKYPWLYIVHSASWLPMPFHFLNLAKWCQFFTFEFHLLTWLPLANGKFWL